MPIGNGSLSSLAEVVDWAQPDIAFSSEGKGHMFESCLARHDFNDLARNERRRVF